MKVPQYTQVYLYQLLEALMAISGTRTLTIETEFFSEEFTFTGIGSPSCDDHDGFLSRFADAVASGGLLTIESNDEYYTASVCRHGIHGDHGHRDWPEMTEVGCHVAD